MSRVMHAVVGSDSEICFRLIRSSFAARFEKPNRNWRHAGENIKQSVVLCAFHARIWDTNLRFQECFRVLSGCGGETTTPRPLIVISRYDAVEKQTDKVPVSSGCADNASDASCQVFLRNAETALLGARFVASFDTLSLSRRDYNSKLHLLLSDFEKYATCLKFQKKLKRENLLNVEFSKKKRKITECLRISATTTLTELVAARMEEKRYTVSQQRQPQHTEALRGSFSNISWHFERNIHSAAVYKSFIFYFIFVVHNEFRKLEF